MVTCTEPLILTGDFNFHVDSSENFEASKFLDIINNFGLDQIVTDETHQSGHTLDLIITRQGDNIVKGRPETKHFISDHGFVHCPLGFPKPEHLGKWITFRPYKQIDIQKFVHDIKQSSLCDLPTTVPDSSDCAVTYLIEQYNTTLAEIRDKHAPSKTKYIVTRPQVPWITPEVKQLKQKRKQLERKWRKNKCGETRAAFQEARNICRYSICSAKNKFYSNKVMECEKDQKKLFTLIKDLLKPKQVMSSFTDLTPDGFSNFFKIEFDKIRAGLENLENHADVQPSQYCGVQNFEKFCLVSDKEVEKLLNKAPNKQCIKDPIPTWLLKQCSDNILPFLTQLVNSSFQHGTFPYSWKEATITPLLKKPDLDLTYSNHRPVSNLTFVSKLVERAAVQQLSHHLNSNCPLPSLQSAYRSGHSTETALIKVQSDILQNMDKQELTLLIMLDLSAAFDTIDHSIMLETLQRDCGVQGVALKWFKSYLEGRKQQVLFNGELSSYNELKYGVPQGSCLGPVLFTIYVAPLFKIISKHLICVHGYADDHQLYTSFKPCSVTNRDSAIKQMELCIKEVRQWMLVNKLKINDNKTELIVIGGRQQLSKLNVSGVTVGCDLITPVKSVRNLGVIFDDNLKMDKQVDKICRTAYYHLRNIRRIRPYLDKHAAETLIHAFVSSQLDYCNGLLAGLPQYLLDKLQHVQNTAVRVLLGLRKFDHITPSLQLLHWLPIDKRITFKICLLVFKALRGLSPNYIRDMIQLKKTGRYKTRSQSGPPKLVVPAVKCVTFGGRAFPSMAPKLWNNLPKNLRALDNIDDFKSKLKTHLFQPNSAVE